MTDLLKSTFSALPPKELGEVGSSLLLVGTAAIRSRHEGIVDEVLVPYAKYVVVVLPFESTRPLIVAELFVMSAASRVVTFGGPSVVVVIDELQEALVPPVPLQLHLY